VAFNVSGNSTLCEHDLFAILEQFKERELIYHYLDLFKGREVPRDFKRSSDTSDKIFFDAISDDFCLISNAIAQKKRDEARGGQQ